MMDRVPDPIVERRIRIARLVKAAKRVGYALFVAAMVLFFVGIATELSGALTAAIATCLVAGSIVLAPAIVLGYAVRSAHREDHELGRL